MKRPKAVKEEARQKQQRAQKIAAANPKKPVPNPKVNQREKVMTDEDFDFIFEHLTGEELQKFIDQAEQELAAKKK